MELCQEVCPLEAEGRGRRWALRSPEGPQHWRGAHIPICVSLHGLLGLEKDHRGQLERGSEEELESDWTSFCCFPG